MKSRSIATLMALLACGGSISAPAAAQNSNDDLAAYAQAMAAKDGNSACRAAVSYLSDTADLANTPSLVGVTGLPEPEAAIARANELSAKGNYAGACADAFAGALALRRAGRDAEIPSYVAKVRALAARLGSASGGGATCASDAAMQKDWQLVKACVDSLMAQARAAKAAGDLAGAKQTYLRAKTVNGYAGTYHDAAANIEIANTVAEIDAAPGRAKAARTAAAAGRGAIPNGSYECYSASTATVLAPGGLAGAPVRLNPGQWHGRIVIAGNTYKLDDNAPGRYSVGAGGKITWNGGAYSAQTLGRYFVNDGTPTIAIGWADVDAGLACTPR